MKEGILYLAMAAIVSLCLTGCGAAVHSNGLNADAILTNVTLTENNYRIVGESIGTASATYVFGIGGLSRRAVTENATADMIRNADLRGPQAIINKTVDVKIRNYIIVVEVDVTVSGQIIEFR